MKIKIKADGIEILNNKYKYLLEEHQVIVGDNKVKKNIYRIVETITDNNVINELIKNIFLTDINKEEYYTSFTLKKLLNNEQVYIDDLALIQV